MSAALAEPGFSALKEYLIAVTGLAYYADKDEDLLVRIRRRFAGLEINDCAAYLSYVQNAAAGASELDRLISELTIGETYFFRQQEQFEALERLVIPDILERNHASGRLRIWSAGCATGAEPYSVALLLQRQFGSRLIGWDVSILGTDINRDSLSRAREGRFDEWAFRGTPDGLKRACFRQDGKEWVIAPEYRTWVTFQYHNLVRDPFPSLIQNLCAFDLVLCRNVMIYFSREVVRELLAQFRESLAEGGWLLVGATEPNVSEYREFAAVISGRETLYRRNGGSAAAPPAPAPVSAPLPPLPASGAAIAPPAPLPAVPPPPAPAAPLARIRELADSGQWELAASACRKVLNQNSLDPLTYFYYGLVLEQSGEQEEAEQALRRAIYLDRGFILGHYHLGLLLQRRDTGRARRAFENALRLLEPFEPRFRFDHGDGITACELAELTRMHLEVLEGM